jgi:hypothetical protein
MHRSKHPLYSITKTGRNRRRSRQAHILHRYAPSQPPDRRPRVCPCQQFYYRRRAGEHKEFAADAFFRIHLPERHLPSRYEHPSVAATMGCNVDAGDVDIRRLRLEGWHGIEFARKTPSLIFSLPQCVQDPRCTGWSQYRRKSRLLLPAQIPKSSRFLVEGFRREIVQSSRCDYLDLSMLKT